MKVPYCGPCTSRTLHVTVPQTVTSPGRVAMSRLKPSALFGQLVGFLVVPLMALATSLMSRRVRSLNCDSTAWNSVRAAHLAMCMQRLMILRQRPMVLLSKHRRFRRSHSPLWRGLCVPPSHGVLFLPTYRAIGVIASPQ